MAYQHNATDLFRIAHFEHRAARVLGENWVGRLASGLDLDVRSIEKWQSGTRALPTYAVVTVELLEAVVAAGGTIPARFDTVKRKRK